MSRQEDFKKNRARLERLIGTCNNEVWTSIEKMAQDHKRSCERAIMVMDHGNFQQAALDAAFTRGEHKIWSWLASIRENAPAELADTERRLAALEKEDSDGQALQQTGKE